MRVDAALRIDRIRQLREATRARIHARREVVRAVRAEDGEDRGVRVDVAVEERHAVEDTHHHHGDTRVHARVQLLAGLTENAALGAVHGGEARVEGERTHALERGVHGDRVCEKIQIERLHGDIRTQRQRLLVRSDGHFY